MLCSIDYTAERCHKHPWPAYKGRQLYHKSKYSSVQGGTYIQDKDTVNTNYVNAAGIAYIMHILPDSGPVEVRSTIANSDPFNIAQTGYLAMTDKRIRGSRWQQYDLLNVPTDWIL